jgi:hypothetical protein
LGSALEKAVKPKIKPGPVFPLNTRQLSLKTKILGKSLLLFYISPAYLSKRGARIKEIYHKGARRTPKEARGGRIIGHRLHRFSQIQEEFGNKNQCNPRNLWLFLTRWRGGRREIAIERKTGVPSDVLFGKAK